MREDIRKADGALLGWLDREPGGRTTVHSINEGYVGYADDTGTYSAREGLRFYGNHPEMLLEK